MKVAIIHYWFVANRGGEKVVEELCSLYPCADIFTLVLDRSVLSPQVAGRNIITSFIDKLPFSKKYYKYYLPLMPIALEQFDLTGYDLVISSESGPAKGVLVGRHAKHLCYCHTPMRYIWEMTYLYTRDWGLLKRILMAPVFHYLRIWDRLSADRVDMFAANSENIRCRIRKYYRRDAVVIHPPVDVDSYTVSRNIGDYYLLAGQLVPYKKADLAVRAFASLPRRLVVIGGGEQLDTLRHCASSNVEILGWQPEDVLRRYYAQCRALVFPGEEDFGMVPVEVMASGRPVIAYGRGGALETVVEGRTGIFFHEQTEAALRSAVMKFEQIEMQFDPQCIRKHAFRFNRDRFNKEIRAAVDVLMRDGEAMYGEKL